MKLAPPSAFKIRTRHLEDLGSSKLNYDNMEFQNESAPLRSNHMSSCFLRMRVGDPVSDPEGLRRLKVVPTLSVGARTPK